MTRNDINLKALRASIKAALGPYARVAIVSNCGDQGLRVTVSHRSERAKADEITGTRLQWTDGGCDRQGCIKEWHGEAWF